VRAFQALVGPNASGKTTFLDVVELLGDLVRLRGDVREAVKSRSTDFSKLVWLGKGNSFKLAVEAPIAESILTKVGEKWRQLTIARYEVEFAFDEVNNDINLDHKYYGCLLQRKLEVILYEIYFQKHSIFPHSCFLQKRAHGR
jgi:predicted ATPase